MNELTIKPAGKPKTITPFIVTDFDLSQQSNLVFHVIGDDYKMSSYGDKIVAKKITGIMRNPETNIQSMFDYYDQIYIGNNYGEPLSLNYLNYAGEGYITGMSMSIVSGQPTGITLNYLETGKMKIGQFINAPKPVQADRADAYEGVEAWARLVIDNIGAQRYDLNPILITNININMSSRYSIINSKKNLVYFGDNPSQAAMLHIERSDTGRYEEYYSMLERLAVQESTQAMLMVGDEIWPVAIVNIATVDSGANVNYLTSTITAIMGKM